MFLMLKKLYSFFRCSSSFYFRTVGWAFIRLRNLLCKVMENMVSHLALSRDYHTLISSKNLTREIKGLLKTILDIVVESKYQKLTCIAVDFLSWKKSAILKCKCYNTVRLNIKGLYVSCTEKNLTYTIFWDKASLRNIPDRSSSVVSTENLVGQFLHWRTQQFSYKRKNVCTSLKIATHQQVFQKFCGFAGQKCESKTSGL